MGMPYKRQLCKAFSVDRHALPKSSLLGFEEDTSNCPSWSFLDDIVLSVCPTFWNTNQLAYDQKIGSNHPKPWFLTTVTQLCNPTLSAIGLAMQMYNANLRFGARCICRIIVSPCCLVLDFVRPEIAQRMLCDSCEELEARYRVKHAFYAKGWVL